MNRVVILIMIMLNLIVAKEIEYQSIEGCSKPSSYLSMSYKMEDNNSINSNIDIEINFISQNDTKIVSINIKEDRELNIISINKSYKELENRDRYDINITTQSLVEGKFYITLYTTTTYNGNFRYKSFIIPIQIGTPKIKYRDRKSDNNFIIYRGVETIGSL
ncbi:hypothetical protein MNB_SV-15-787 [hydrothermal vent metagenome]|uniref:Uncharacterized protein n=1 Tax=hydrothermal vent metagenome TaxID=652676 RepID=A0A1W1EI04_9ZZZZ